jgi:hypothetical protein
LYVPAYWIPLYWRVGGALAIVTEGAFCTGSAGVKQLPPSPLDPSLPASFAGVEASSPPEAPLEDPALDDPPLEDPGAGAEDDSLPEHATSAHPTKSAVSDRMVDSTGGTGRNSERA